MHSQLSGAIPVIADSWDLLTALSQNCPKLRESAGLNWRRTQ
jgi:hypothetical protein